MRSRMELKGMERLKDSDVGCVVPVNTTLDTVHEIHMLIPISMPMGLY